MPIYKIGQFTDVHGGYKSGQLRHPETGINLREQDGYDAFKEVIDQILEVKENGQIDATICSGDIFHSPSPSVKTIVEIQKQLKRLSSNDIPFYNIAGNHDATDSVRDIPSNGVLDFPELKMYSYTTPYVVEEIFPDVVCHFVSHHGFLEQEETFKKVNPIKDKFNILITHGSVFDNSINGILHSESEPREVVISEELMSKDWDYTLLGHIHERGWVHSKDKITDTSGRRQFYGGSLIRRGFADKECKLGRGWTLWTIDTEKKTMTPEFYYVKQRLQKDLLFFCENKTPEEVTEEVFKAFEAIDFSKNPILRATFIDLNKAQESLIPWKDIYSLTRECLTFSKKIKSKEEFKKEISSYNFSFDLLTAYKEFWENLNTNYNDKEFEEKVKKTSEELLKKGQEKVMM